VESNDYSLGANGMAMLKLLNGPSAGRIKRLTNRALIFGRHNKCDVVLRNQLVSRKHARIYRQPDGFYIEDLGSRNGTIVNGERLVATHQLEDADWIEIGATIFEFSDRLVAPVPGLEESQVGPGEDRRIVEWPTTVDLEADHESAIRTSAQVRLQAVLQIARDLGNCLDLAQIHQRIVDCSMRVFPTAESIYILEADDVSGGLIPVATHKRSSSSDSTLTPGRIPRSLVIRAIKHEAAVARKRISESVDDMDASFMCAPLIGTCRNLLGLICLEFRDDHQGEENEDKDLLTCIAALASQSLEQVHTHSGRYRAVVNASAQAILTIDEQGIIQSANPAAERVFDYDADKLVNREIATLIPQLDIARKSEWKRLLENYSIKPGQPSREAVGQRADGKQFPIEISLAEFKLAGKSNYTVICQDITVRKRAEQELRDSRERLSRLMQTGIVGITFGNSQGAILEVNDAFCQFSGYTREELVELGIKWEDLNAPEYAEIDRQAFANLTQSGVYGPYEKELIRKDGGRLPVSVSAAVLPGKVDENVLFLVDNTRRKKAEQELLTLNAALEKTVIDRTRNVRLLQDVAVIANEAESVQQAFKAAVETICRHIGWPAGRAVLCQRRAEADVFQQVGAWYWELPFPARNNKDPSALVLRVVNSGKPARSNLVHGIVDGADKTREDGCEVRSAFAFPICLGAKVWGVLEFLATTSTIPSRELIQTMTHLCTQLGRVIERRQLQQELIDAVWNQHRRFGQELHDSLGQELTGIRMMADTLRWKLETKSLPESTAATQLTTYIQEAQDHARQLSKGLFPVDIFECGLTVALEELAEHASAHANDVRCVFVGGHTVQVCGNEVATQLFRIAQEAVNNSLKHSQAQHIEISLRKEGITLILEVCDDGIGIDEADLTGRRGMGLQIMRYRANAVGGAVAFHSKDGRGLKVRCTLECPEDAKESPAPLRNSPAHCR
jgi:PAS domain S-box-containing protein